MRWNKARLLQVGCTTALLAWSAGCAPPATLVREPGTAYGELRGCEAETEPEVLPSADALVDTAALTSGLQDLRDAFAVETGDVILTMWYDPDGANARRTVVATSLEPTVADSVQELVFAALKTAPEREGAWGGRLEIALGEEIAYRVSHREYCPARPRSIELENATRRIPFSGVGTVLVEVLVHPLGYVTDVRLVRGASPGGRLEQQLSDYMRQYSFEPARVDGIPVPGRVTLPVRVR